MKLAVMQPYLFPYIGYYQLVNSVDKFVFYDDVHFIKSGYINRNNILSNGKKQLFTIPVLGGSSNKLISELSFSGNVKKIIKTIEQSYSKAPYFSSVFPIIEKVFSDEDKTVVSITSASIREVFDYIGIQKEFLISSKIDNNKNLPAKDRLVQMSKILQCHTYINSPGGKDLYSKSYFDSFNIDLKFIQPKIVDYEQGGGDFESNLSIIDVLMWNDKEAVRKMLNQYELT